MVEAAFFCGGHALVVFVHLVRSAYDKWHGGLHRTGSAGRYLPYPLVRPPRGKNLAYKTYSRLCPKQVRHLDMIVLDGRAVVFWFQNEAAESGRKASEGVTIRILLGSCSHNVCFCLAYACLRCSLVFRRSYHRQLLLFIGRFCHRGRDNDRFAPNGWMPDQTEPPVVVSFADWNRRS